jgi:hypothetical protein
MSDERQAEKPKIENLPKHQEAELSEEEAAGARGGGVLESVLGQAVKSVGEATSQAARKQ